MTNIKERHAEALKSHKAHMEKLKSLLQHGDWKQVGKEVGISSTYAIHSFQRIGSKHHKAVVNSLEKIINNRIDDLYQ